MLLKYDNILTRLLVKSSKTNDVDFRLNVFKNGAGGWVFGCSRVGMDTGLVSMAKINKNHCIKKQIVFFPDTDNDVMMQLVMLNERVY